MTLHASGPFDVDLVPAKDEHLAQGAMLARMLITKRYHGALEATGIGEMLTAGTATPGSAVYVAVEHVNGVLAGKRGTFALRHSGTMTRGTPSLAIDIVPDSGTEELAGISGTMQIVIEGGKHSYELQYTL